MSESPHSPRPLGSDPLLPPQPADSRAVSARRPPNDERRAERATPRRQHPARGARAVALVASVAATGAVAATLAYSEGVWSADDTRGATPSDDAASEVQPVSESTAGVAVGTDTPITEPVASVLADDPSTSVASETVPTTTANTVSTSSTTQPTETAAPSSGWADGTYLGTAEYTEWGDVQVQVTISDGVIVDAVAVDYPTGRKSSAINEQALPLLEADALVLQSADVEVVSGATYTSWTYADSLQAALDAAALAAQSAEVTS